MLLLQLIEVKIIKKVVKEIFLTICRSIYIVSHILAWMAEWSNAPDLSSGLFGGAGSNPASGIYPLFKGFLSVDG